MSYRSTRDLTALLSLTSFVALTACSSSDENPPPPPAASVAFTASMDQAQELPAPIAGNRVRVTITNSAPNLGTFQTPVWVGFHDGGFDLYDAGSPATTFFPTTNGLERIAEDGNADPLSEAFTAQGFGTAQGLLAGSLGPAAGPIAPGETVSRIFELDPTDATNRYFSYASMVIPSNDAFIANGDPLAHEIFDGAGTFVAVDFVVLGTAALDAGTEVNDEVAANTAFFGQATPDTGTAEGANVGAHAGYIVAGPILSDAMFTNADFINTGGYQFLSVRFEDLGAAVATPAGIAQVNLNGANVEYTIAATGLSGTVTGAHFHMAAAGLTGAVVVTLTDDITLNTSGNLNITGSQVAPAGFVDALRAGNIYINVHTALNPGGELRGQLTDDEAFSGTLTTAQEVPAPVAGVGVRVRITNNAPALGTFHTPVWVGFHDGGFDTYDLGSAAATYFPVSNGLERLAEDGTLDNIQDGFQMQGFGTIQGALAGILGPAAGPIAPGETVSKVFNLNPAAMQSGYFSYASMIIPSNDAFVSDGDPLGHPIYDGVGTFVATNFTVLGSEALDAGTEVNDETAMNTAFFGQTTPDTGTVEGANVALHAGYTPAGPILSDAMFTGADFTMGGYEFLDFEFTELGAGPSGSGIVLVTLNPGETDIAFAVAAHDLSGEVTAMHFHNAALGVAGPVLINITSSIVLNEGGVLSAQGTSPVLMTFVDALRAGEIYLNVHTGLNPSGELRAQVTLSE